MSDDVQVVEDFYRAFQKRDAARMGASYASDATFSDPVFPALAGEQVPAMWSMLCERGKDLKVTFENVRTEGDAVRAHWEATYTFSTTGRPVHNIVEATLHVRDGRITRHVDSFDFWRWSRMALGLPGTLLGWSPIVRNKVRAQSASLLRRYMEASGTGREGSIS